MCFSDAFESTSPSPPGLKVMNSLHKCSFVPNVMRGLEHRWRPTEAMGYAGANTFYWPALKKKTS